MLGQAERSEGVWNAQPPTGFRQVAPENAGEEEPEWGNACRSGGTPQKAVVRRQSCPSAQTQFPSGTPFGAAVGGVLAGLLRRSRVGKASLRPASKVSSSGFKKNDTDRWEFANDGFIKDQKHLLMSINRKKASQLTTQQKVAKPKMININAHEGNKYADLWKKVECLKTDKNMLMQELVKQRQHQKTSQNKMLVLREQLKGMEQDQEQMLAFIVVAMQNPGFLANPVQSKENNWLRSEPSCKTVLKPVRKGSEHVVRPSEGAIVKYHPPSEDLDSTSEDSGEPDLTSEELEDPLEDMDLLCGSPQNENHGPFIIHDPSDSDCMLDQLLSGPSENKTTSF